MLQQAIDFREESETLFALLDTVRDQEWNQKTQFKGWTINDVVAHVHLGNYMADLSLRDSAAFVTFMQSLASARTQGSGHLSVTHAWLQGTKGRALLQQWRDFYLEMAERFAVADPKKRVKWAGPDMSVRSSITARLMETWAPGSQPPSSEGTRMPFVGLPRLRCSSRRAGEGCSRRSRPGTPTETNWRSFSAVPVERYGRRSTKPPGAVSTARRAAHSTSPNPARSP
jgi:hypothetical protein